MTPQTTVAICVATYKRPLMLTELLKSLAELSQGDIDLTVIVGDNNPDRSAFPIVEELRGSMPFPMVYVHEPEQGLVTVLNTMIQEANKLDVEYVGIVDDDETTDPEWLVSIVSAAKKFNADGVGGQSIYQIPADVPEHIQRCFEFEPRTTGKVIQTIIGNNGLFRLEALNSIPGPYDVRFNLTGGEDVMLSAELAKQGYVLVGCAEAVTYETVPESRQNAKWILRRGYRSGISYTQVLRLTDTSLTSLGKHAVKALIRILAGSAQLLWSLAVNRRDRLFCARRIAFGAGSIVAIFNKRAQVEEYKTVHGA